MYKITFKDTVTDTTCVEYCFTRRLGKLVYFLENERTADFYKRFEILWINKLVLNFDTFEKCLTSTIKFEK